MSLTTGTPLYLVRMNDGHITTYKAVVDYRVINHSDDVKELNIEIEADNYINRMFGSIDMNYVEIRDETNYKHFAVRGWYDGEDGHSDWMYVFANKEDANEVVLKEINRLNSQLF